MMRKILGRLVAQPMTRVPAYAAFRFHSSTKPSENAPKRPPKKSELFIQNASWDDMETIANFIRSTADWYRPFVDEKDMSEHNVPPEWKRKNFYRRDFYLASTDDSGAVGTVSYQDFGNYAYIGYVYLDQSQTGQGFGGKLLNFVKARAIREGKHGMVLIAHPSAHWATKAYVKFGFELKGSTRDEVISWNNGALKDYYEEGFQLYVYPIKKSESSAPRVA